MTSLSITGGIVLAPEHLGRADVHIVDGVVATAAPATGAGILDATGCTVTPGFIDVQCNGGFGIDLARSPERLWELGARLASTGVTTWVPTIVSTPPEVAERAIAALASRPDGYLGAEPLGLHLEGPALNPRRRGAHPAAALQLPTAALVASWSRQRGVRLVTLAPELPGALAAVRALRSAGVVVAAGHTDATTEDIRAALDAGVSMVTHLFNAMVPFAHREPGPVGVALTDGRVHVGLIADGHHAHPIAVALAWRAAGADRIVLVTDAVAPMGTKGAPEVARLDDGTIAGSTLTMDQAVRNALEWTGAPLAAVIRAATANPAAAVDAGDRGRLQAGARGDAVVLDDGSRVVATVCGGEVAFGR